MPGGSLARRNEPLRSAGLREPRVINRKRGRRGSLLLSPPRTPAIFEEPVTGTMMNPAGRARRKDEGSS